MPAFPESSASSYSALPSPPFFRSTRGILLSPSFSPTTQNSAPVKSSQVRISVGLFGHAGDDEVWTEGTKEMLDDMHKRKIDMADEIYVINVGGYIGSSTRSEIKYAEATGKAVRYLEALCDEG